MEFVTLHSWKRNIFAERGRIRLTLRVATSVGKSQGSLVSQRPAGLNESNNTGCEILVKAHQAASVGIEFESY